MEISKIFGLNKSQAELDFIDIDVTKDIALFLDSYFLGIRLDPLSMDASNTVKSFFKHLIKLIQEGKKSEAFALFSRFKEPNTTCLGLSKSKPQGKGPGHHDAQGILKNIMKSKAVETGLIQDLEDSILFVDGFGKDKLSDMTTNLITKHLITYTQEQCKLHNINSMEQRASGYYWDADRNLWVNEYTNMLIVNNKPILLIPKGIASYCDQYTPEKYYNKFVLEYLQNDLVSIEPIFKSKKANGKEIVHKKTLKQSEEYAYSKEYLREFTKQHLPVLNDIKQKTKIHSLPDGAFTNINFSMVASKLLESLVSIPTGSTDASRYHKLMIGIVEFIFYPQLINPKVEREINDGRKRIDIVYDNASKNGVFSDLRQRFNFHCPYIFVECKNYTSDVGNPELDQLMGRFSDVRGKVGILLCRRIDNLSLVIKRCNDALKDRRELIIPLTDEDVIFMISNMEDDKRDVVDKCLHDRIRAIYL